MSLTLSENSKPSFPPIEDGTYPAVCYLLADLGEQFNEKYAKYSKQVVIGWEIIGETVTIDGEEKARTYHTTYTASLDSKAKLRKALIAWRGRDFTVEELKAFDLKNILGAPCFIQLVNNKKEDTGKTYTNLASIARLPKGFDVPKPTLPFVTYDIDKDDPSAIAKLPEWIQKKITDSKTYQERLASANMTELDDSDGELPF